MSDLVIPRRKFLIGLGALVATPAIVRASSLMPIKLMEWNDWHHYAVVRKNGVIQFYLNGLLTDTNDMPVVPSVVNKRLHLDHLPLIDEFNITGELHGDFTAEFLAKRGNLA